MMKRAFTAGSALLAAAALAPQPAAPAADTVRVDRGRYLVTVAGCHDCHTPKKMGPKGPELDMSRILSGHPEGSRLPAPPTLPPGPWMGTLSWDLTAWSGPWGISYATKKNRVPEAAIAPPPGEKPAKP